MTARSTRWVLASRPHGAPVPENFRRETLELLPLEEGQLRVRVRYVSIDPTMRGWMSQVPSYLPPIAIDDVIRAFGVGEVVESRNPRFTVGASVSGLLGVQTYHTSGGRDLSLIDTTIGPLSWYLGPLGMNGITAYFGILEVGAIKAGETVLVSGAAGATGSLVGQIAKLNGCRVVGIAGGPKKCAHLLDELGFDAAIDYKSDRVGRKIREFCPDGIDVFFDNVGGDTLDAALARINIGARVVICGAISQYNNTGAVQGPKNYLSLLVRRARMEGFLVLDYLHRSTEAVVPMARWAHAGQLKWRETVLEGLDAFPDALGRLFTGEKLGKLYLSL